MLALTNWRLIMKRAYVCRWLAQIGFCVILAGGIGCGTRENVSSTLRKIEGDQVTPEARFNAFYAELQEYRQKPEVVIMADPRVQNDCAAFRQIVADGEVSMPFIVQEMERGDFYLFQAMEEITGMKVSDYYSDYPTTLQGISALWIKWWHDVGSKTPGQRDIWQRVATEGKSEPKLSFEELRALLVKHGVEVSNTTNTRYLMVARQPNAWRIDEIACTHTGFNARIHLEDNHIGAAPGEVEAYSSVVVPNTDTGRKFLQFIVKEVSPSLADWLETVPDAEGQPPLGINAKRHGSLWILAKYWGSNLEFRCEHQMPGRP